MRISSEWRMSVVRSASRIVLRASPSSEPPHRPCGGLGTVRHWPCIGPGSAPDRPRIGSGSAPGRPRIRHPLGGRFVSLRTFLGGLHRASSFAELGPHLVGVQQHLAEFAHDCGRTSPSPAEFNTRIWSDPPLVVAVAPNLFGSAQICRRHLNCRRVEFRVGGTQPRFGKTFAKLGRSYTKIGQRVARRSRVMINLDASSLLSSFEARCSACRLTQQACIFMIPPAGGGNTNREVNPKLVEFNLTSVAHDLNSSKFGPNLAETTLTLVDANPDSVYAATLFERKSNLEVPPPCPWGRGAESRIGEHWLGSGTPWGASSGVGQSGGGKTAKHQEAGDRRFPKESKEEHWNISVFLLCRM